MRKLEGTLRYDQEADRLYVNDERECDGRHHFHCGESLEVRHDGAWRETRVEHSDDWYLVGLYRAGQIPSSLRARF